MNPRLSWFFVGAAVFLAMSASASARGPASSRRTYVGAAPGDFELGLRQNLERFQVRIEMAGLLEESKTLGANLDKYKGNFDPKTLKYLEDQGKNLDPKDTGKLLDVLAKGKKFRDFVAKTHPSLGDPKKLEDVQKDIRQKDKASAGGPPPKGPAQQTMPPPPPAEEEDDEEDFTRTMRNWLEKAKDWGGVGDLLRDSSALQEALDSLTQGLLNSEGGLDWDGLDLSGRFGDMSDYARRALEGLGGRLPDLKGFRLPTLPNFHGPHLSAGGLFPHLPGLGGAGGIASGLGSFLLWLVVLGGLGLVLWQLLKRLPLGAARPAAGSAWRLGPWPVDPARVASRDELIRAFEYLALLLFGQPARSWNHREIAASLGRDAEAARQTAADRLAARYEQARYAPGGEPLTGAALAEARRDLCLLAGVAGA